MPEHKDKGYVSGSDSDKYRKNYPKIFGREFRKFKWIKIIKNADSVESDSCPIDGRRVMTGNLLAQPIPTRCKESIHGRCAYCGDVSAETDIEHKIQCFYPIVQRVSAWQPEKPKEKE